MGLTSEIKTMSKYDIAINALKGIAEYQYREGTKRDCVTLAVNALSLIENIEPKRVRCPECNKFFGMKTRVSKLTVNGVDYHESCFKRKQQRIFNSNKAG